MQALLKNAKTIPCSLGVRRLATQSTPSTTTIARSPIVWTYLPQQLPYHLGLLLQETLVANRLSAKALLSSPLDAFSPSKIASLRRTADTDILLLLQHTPVYTAGRREKDPEVARLEGERLGALGADYVSTMRGGQTTYHGPGQLVGYSIFDMGAANLSTRCYVDYMETFLASLTTSLGVKVYPLEHTGVFTSPTSKIGSIGIHIRRRITLHGFSINIEEQTLDWFRNIVACGLDDVSATSVQTELKKITKSEGREIKVGDVVERAVKGFGEGYDREMIMLDGQEENRELQEVIDDGIAGRLPPLAE